MSICYDIVRVIIISIALYTTPCKYKIMMGVSQAYLFLGLKMGALLASFSALAFEATSLGHIASLGG